MASPAALMLARKRQEDGEAQAQDEAGRHSLSCLLCVRSVMSSPGGSLMRNSTASSRVRFWKLVSFTCHGKALRHGPNGEMEDPVGVPGTAAPRAGWETELVPVTQVPATTSGSPGEGPWAS